MRLVWKRKETEGGRTFGEEKTNQALEVLPCKAMHTSLNSFVGEYAPSYDLCGTDMLSDRSDPLAWSDDGGHAPEPGFRWQNLPTSYGSTSAAPIAPSRKYGLRLSNHGEHWTQCMMIEGWEGKEEDMLRLGSGVKITRYDLNLYSDSIPMTPLL